MDTVAPDARQELSGDEARLRLLLGSVAQAIWETDAAGVVVTDSPSWRAYTGQTVEEWLGYGWLDAIHPEDRVFAERQWREAMATHSHVDTEFRLRAFEGGWRWTNVRAAPVIDGKGLITAWAGMNIDIDRRKRAETALLEREADLARVQRIGGIGGLDIDIAGGLTSQRSPEYLRLHGLPQDESNGTHADWLTRVHPDDRERAEKTLFDALNGGSTSYENEYRVIRPNDGAVRWISARADIERDASGGGVRLVGAHVDITEQKHAQAELSASEQRFRTLAETALALIWQNDAEGKNVFINRAFLNYSGLESSDVSGDQWRTLIHPDDAEAYIADYMAAVGERRPFHNRNRIRRHDGAWCWFENYAQPLWDEQAHYVGHVGVSTDVTAIVRAGQAARESDRRQAFLLRFSDALRVETDVDTVANLAIRLILEEMSLDRCYITFYHLEDDRADFPYQIGNDKVPPLPEMVRLSDFPDAFEQVLHGTVVIEDDFERRGLSDEERRNSAGLAMRALLASTVRRGESNPYCSLAAVSGNPRHWTQNDVALVEEVAERTWAAMERVRSEGALRQSQERFRALAVAGGTSIYRMSADWRLMYHLNSDTLATTSEPIENWVDKYIPPDDLSRVHRAIDEAIQSKSLFELEHRVWVADGGIGWVLSRAVPLLDENGEITEWFGAGSVVTARKQAEERLRESEDRYRALFESMDEAYAVVEVLKGEDGHWCDFRFINANPAFMLHTTMPHPVGRTATDLLGQPNPRWTELYGRALDTGQPLRLEEAEPTLHKVFDLNIFTLDRATNRVAVLFTDITDRKRSELALRNSERWLQTLMAGVPQLVFRAVDGGCWTWASPQWTDFTGQTEKDSHDWGWLDLVHPQDRKRTQNAWADAIDRGEFHADYRLCHRTEGRYRWFQTRATPVRDDKGRIVEWLGTSTDVDDLRRLQDRQQVLLAELQHRVRNILAVTRSIISRSNDGERSTEDYVAHLQGRIAALARTQVLLTRTADTRVDLEALIHDELLAQAASEDQFSLQGESVAISPKSAEVVTLAVHELATNATKYGAFSRPSGRLQVSWRVEERAGQTWLILLWRESGIPIVTTAPRRQGFGLELITRRIPYELKGYGSFDVRPGGMESRIEFPIVDGESILQTDAGRR